jgi:hypothetical protein
MTLRKPYIHGVLMTSPIHVICALFILRSGLGVSINVIVSVLGVAVAWWWLWCEGEDGSSVMRRESVEAEVHEWKGAEGCKWEWGCRIEKEAEKGGGGMFKLCTSYT